MAAFNPFLAMLGAYHNQPAPNTPQPMSSMPGRGSNLGASVASPGMGYNPGAAVASPGMNYHPGMPLAQNPGFMRSPFGSVGSGYSPGFNPGTMGGAGRFAPDPGFTPMPQQQPQTPGYWGNGTQSDTGLLGSMMGPAQGAQQGFGWGMNQQFPQGVQPNMMGGQQAPQNPQFQQSLASLLGGGRYPMT